HPLVRARLECQRLGLLEFAFVFQVVRKERSLNLFAKVLTGRALEIDAAKLLAFAAAPAPVVPRADDQIIQMSRVVLLESLIDAKRPVEIFRVPPAGYVPRRDFRSTGLTLECPTLPAPILDV